MAARLSRRSAPSRSTTRRRTVHGVADRASRPLVVWSGVLLVLLAAHDLSHLLDSGLDTKASQLALIAVPQWIVLGIVMTIIVRGEPRVSAIAGFLLGAGAAVGFALVHLAPFAPADYWGLSPTTVSWALAWIPTGVGVLVAWLAWSELRDARVGLSGVSRAR